MRYGRSRRRARVIFALLFCALVAASFSCVQLPRKGLSSAGQTAPPQVRTPAGHSPRINLNTARADELEKLPGIGRSLAARIISFREQFGRFRRPEHIMMVRGISDRRFRSLRALVTAE
jgi:competence protein ComEA